MRVGRGGRFHSNLGHYKESLFLLQGKFMWSHLAKHVSQACKIDPGERENLPVKFSRKQEQSLNGLLG